MNDINQTNNVILLTSENNRLKHENINIMKTVKLFLVIAVISAACLIIPAINERPTFDNCIGAPSS